MPGVRVTVCCTPPVRVLLAQLWNTPGPASTGVTETFELCRRGSPLTPSRDVRNVVTYSLGAPRFEPEPYSQPGKGDCNMALSTRQIEQLAGRGFTRRHIGRMATLLTAGAAFPFYNEFAMAQDAEQRVRGGRRQAMDPDVI